MSIYKQCLTQCSVLLLLLLLFVSEPNFRCLASLGLLMSVYSVLQLKSINSPIFFERHEHKPTPFYTTSTVDLTNSTPPPKKSLLCNLVRSFISHSHKEHRTTKPRTGIETHFLNLPK